MYVADFCRPHQLADYTRCEMNRLNLAKHFGIWNR
jgi:hypothetical protein